MDDGNRDEEAPLITDIIPIQALYDYTAQYEDELSFSAGAVMALEKELDSNWLQARLGRQVGLVPLTYINILEPLDSQDDIEQSVSNSPGATCEYSCSVHLVLLPDIPHARMNGIVKTIYLIALRPLTSLTI